MKLLRAFYGVLPLLMLALLVTPLEAQQNRLGFVGGITMANLGGDDGGDTDSSLGFDIGAFLSWSVADMWAIRPGLFYVQKGADASEGIADIELHFDYVEFPLLIELRVPTSGNLGVHFFAGPAVAFEVGCTVEGTDSGRSVELDCDDALFGGDLDTKAVDFGLMFGGGVQFPVGQSLDVLIEANYNLGLTSIDDSGSDADIKNRAFQVNAGVSFPVGS